MGRNHRVEYYGAIYHIIERGNNREFIFSKNEHKHMLIQIIREEKANSDFEILGYVVMDNHYHIILKIKNHSLGRIMQRINNRYSRYYNINESRTGPNFEKRYTSYLINDESYLVSLIKYIHFNPVRAKMVEKVIDYEFSSDSNYRNNIYDVVDTDLILSILSKDKENAIEIYAEIMKSDKPIEKYVSKPKYKTDEVVIIEETKKLDEILAEICITKEIFTKIKEKNRSSVLTEYKVKYIQVSKHVGYTYEEIGRNIGISGNAAAMLIKRKDSYVN